MIHYNIFTRNLCKIWSVHIFVAFADNVKLRYAIIFLLVYVLCIIRDSFSEIYIIIFLHVWI